MNTQETLCLMALTRVPRMSLTHVRSLVDALGSATAIYEHRNSLGDVLPGARKPTLEALADMHIHLEKAEKELEWDMRNGIQCIGIHDEAYPQRLRECPDAPVILYYKGQANLNAPHVVSVVGTRHITEYGKDLCATFLRDLHALCPDALVVSGLAYGVDIHAHRAALDEGSLTVGVLAHGLDQIYPRMHRDTAVRMVTQGGLLTEFMSGTNADKRNFVQRNRIVAGISDVTVVVESATKGGSLITAELASDYNREVVSFPGRINDKYSEGCNNLIRTSRAALITSAEDMVELMDWETEKERQRCLAHGVQTELFPNLSAEEQQVVQAMQGTDKVHLNHIAQSTGLPIGKLSSILFGLEMKGLVKMLNGGMYRLA
ncbi:MAG: DNA-processing protein DprA [Bacteroidaceae bacterium]|nr:DNA-processing protein DprA [Bacteroidaceae bacterium]